MFDELTKIAAYTLLINGSAALGGGSVGAPAFAPRQLFPLRVIPIQSVQIRGCPLQRFHLLQHRPEGIFHCIGLGFAGQLREPFRHRTGFSVLDAQDHLRVFRIQW